MTQPLFLITPLEVVEPAGCRVALREALDDFCRNLQALSVALRRLDPVTKREVRDTKESQILETSGGDAQKKRVIVIEPLVKLAWNSHAS
jgi:hypothetical protein